MDTTHLGEMEMRFADLIWTHAPVGSGELVHLCAEAFDWKKSTTYTMLKRLCLRGIFKNENGTVRVLIARDEFAAMEGERFLNERFDGSLPLFVAAFSRRGKLKKSEVQTETAPEDDEIIDL